MNEKTNAKQPVVDNKTTLKAKQVQLKKQKAKAETARFKSKYFDYYDDIKISDRQDW
ncbi:MAG: hypothetical protein IKL82_00470 [Clostridia bacterium]|nr:hypothetical protein [Clostridia bacterium]